MPGGTYVWHRLSGKGWQIEPTCERYFRRRRCHGLTYQSQREPAYDRALKQANRIRKRLGDDMSSVFEWDELPPKPPRMR
jgi:hypothetical protein